MRRLVPLICISTCLRWPALAQADLCTAKVLHPVAAIDNPSSMMSQGAILDSITQFNVDKHTGMREFCQHGGYCYTETITIDGKQVKSLKLTNCRIDKVVSEDADTQFWSLDVVRSAVSKNELRYSDISGKLGDLGLCVACADNAADVYIKQPDSPCGQTVKAAFEGNPEAVTKLNDTDICPVAPAR